MLKIFRCNDKDQSRGVNQVFKMNCSPGGGTGGGEGNNCTDSEENCAYWQRQGHCSDGQYVDWMAKNCPKSCGKCPTTTRTTTTRPTPATTRPPTTKPTTVGPPVECEDKRKSCGCWSLQNLCNEGYVDRMAQNCPKSCGKCKSLLKFLLKY